MNTINIVHLYAKEMNIYGDNGNVLVLKKRLEWRGHIVKVTRVGVGDNLPSNTHIVVGGGGQDAGQSLIANDLKRKASTLKELSDAGVPMLMICGMYQMFGNYFKTNQGEIIKGIGLLDVYTIAGSKRIIGNIDSTTDFGALIGYENHSGCTYLQGDTKPLGFTKFKQGNNGKDKTEGAYYKNIFGTYMHGPVLAKAPDFADYLILKTLNSAGHKEPNLKQIDDKLTDLAQKSALSRPR